MSCAKIAITYEAIALCLDEDEPNGRLEFVGI